MTDLPAGKCNEILHDARNSLLSLRGYLIALRDDLEEKGVRADFSDINIQIQRIGAALRKCG